MTATLADLLTLYTQEQWYAILLAVAQAEGFPVQSWQDGAVEKTRLLAMSSGLESLGAITPAIAGGTLLDYSPNFPGWTGLTAQQIYSLAQNIATFTQGNVLATNVSTQAYAFNGNLKFNFGASGRNYFSIGAGTIPAAVGITPGTLVIPVIAENPGSAYADPSNSGVLQLVTSLPGVTITNPAGPYASATGTHTGSGTGIITASGTPSLPHSLVITITSTGQVGVATWSYSLDGGAPIAAGTASTLVNIGGSGITVTLTNGALNPSFVINDTYSYAAPGSWIASQGSDAETDQALVLRCRNRWSSLSDIPTSSLYQLLATSTPIVGSQVTQASVVVDPFVNNKVNIIVSGPGGVLPAPTITAIQAYVSPYARGCDNPVVQSPTTLVVTIGGSVNVLVSKQAAATAAIQTAMQAYVATIGVNGTLRISSIVELIMMVAGVVDVSGVTINGVAANLVLGGVGSYVLPFYPPALALNYVAT